MDVQPIAMRPPARPATAAAAAPAGAPAVRPHDFEAMPDEALARACLAGHRAAWDAMVRRFQRLVYTVPRRAGLSEAAASDVFQTCFARLFEHLPHIEDLSRVRAWLVTTARRETLRQLGWSQRQVDPRRGDGDADDGDLLERIADPAPLHEEELERLQEIDRVRSAVDRLAPRSRRFVELLFLQDEPLPYAEIARRLDMPPGSIGPTRARCLAKLRELLLPTH